MFAIVFSTLLAVAILSVCGNIVMRVRLTTRKPSTDKFKWWKRGFDEVGDTYRQVFPGSYLPLLLQMTFWLLVALAAVALVLVYVTK